MTAADLFPVLCETTIAASAAIVLVLGLRRSLRNAFGAGIAYSAWALVPLAILAVLLPAAPSPVRIVPVMAMEMPGGLRAVGGVDATADLATWGVIAFACGALASMLWMFVQQRRFARALGRLAESGDGVFIAESTNGLPAVMGLIRPRIVLPADAMHRYDATERDLVLAHERAHIARGDLLANAGVAALRCLFWFNPLVHLGARHFRHDQELACDQHVVRRHPHARRAYGEAMLKTQLAHGVLPLGCHWAQTHPLRERIEMLKQPVFSLRRRVLGRAIAFALLCATGYAAWAAQPQAATTTSIKPGMGQGTGVDAAMGSATTTKSAGPMEASVRPSRVIASMSASKPTTASQAKAATPIAFNTYERMLTSLSDSWTPPKPPQDDC